MNGQAHHGPHGVATIRLNFCFHSNPGGQRAGPDSKSPDGAMQLGKSNRNGSLIRILIKLHVLIEITFSF